MVEVTEESGTTGRLPVCVLIPAYNRAEHLENCLRSVWAQKPYLPSEVLVVDDGSTDGTAEVATSLGAHVLGHPSNRGLAAARNSGLAATRQRWVALLDTDDEWLPNHLAELWRLRGDHALVGTSALWRYADANRDRFHGPAGRRPLELRSPDWLIQTDNVFCASASMVDREVALELGGFEARNGVSEDFELWVRILERYSAVCSSVTTVVYHVHDEQMSADWERMHRGHRHVALAHFGRTGRSSRALDRWEGVAAWDRMRTRSRQGRRSAAVRQFVPTLADPQRVIGLLMLFWYRFRLRRRAAEVGRDGQASVAVLVRDPALRQKVRTSLNGRTVRDDLPEVPKARSLLALARRPAGLVITDSPLCAAALRIARMRAAEPASVL